MLYEALNYLRTGLMVILALVLIGANLNAQDTSEMMQDKSIQSMNTDDNFTPEAKRLSIELMQEVGYSLEKASQVRDILIDYNKDIREARNEYMETRKDEGEVAIQESDSDNDARTTDNTDVIGSDNVADLDDILGYDVGIYYQDASPDLMTSYKEADRNANEEIVDLLSDDQQQKYEKVKNQWWKEVKDAVYSPYYDKTDTRYDKDSEKK